METRSKKFINVTKTDITATEYERMCKVRVSLNRFNVDSFLKIGLKNLSNEKESDNIHVSSFHHHLAVSISIEQSCNFLDFGDVSN